MDRKHIIKNTLSEGLNLQKKQEISAIKDMGDFYLVNSEILTNLIQEAVNPIDGEVSYKDVSEYDNNSINFDVYFHESYIVESLEKTLTIIMKSLSSTIFNPIIDVEYIDTDEDSHLFSLYLVYDKEVRDESYVYESVDLKKPLIKQLFQNKSKIKKTLLTKYNMNESVVNTIFKQETKQIAESLLKILDKKVVKGLVKEGQFKCSIQDVEKKAKSIIFVKYNWDPKNVLFQTDNDAVQITVMDDLKPELQTANDESIVKFLESLSTGYTKDLNKQFVGFCGKIGFLAKFTTHITSSVYCYTIVQQPDGIFLFSSNGEKKKLKKGDHPQYQLNKLYFKIGLFASNVVSEGLNSPKINNITL